MRVTDEFDTKEMRRTRLALTLLRLGSRTHIIREWTRLTEARIKKIRDTHTYEFPGVELRRPTGRSPGTLCELSRSPDKRCQAAVLGGLCRVFGVIPKPSGPGSRRYLPSIPRGEQVCEIFDQFYALVPGATLTIDEFICLLYSLADGEQHAIDWCKRCEGAILIDPYGAARRVCLHCVAQVKAQRISRKRLSKELPRESQTTVGTEAPGLRCDQLPGATD